jgi:hypothetical protein
MPIGSATFSADFPITATLAAHLVTGGGVAGYLRESPTLPSSEAGGHNLISALLALLESDEDHDRRETALRFARAVLVRNDADEYVDLLRIVAQQEKRHTPTYEKHREHTAHVVYLWLLGLWFYDNVPSFREAFDRSANPGTSHRIVSFNSFCAQWLFASLLHDVGYVFDVLSDSSTRADRAIVDGMFDLAYLHSQLPALPSRIEARLDEVHGLFVKTYLEPITEEFGTYEECSTPSAILKRLSQGTWIRELSSDWHQVRDLFDVFALKGRPQTGVGLRSYAEAVATLAISGDACVDHGVASGLLLFQYSSYWYWLYHQMEDLFPEVLKDLRRLGALDADYSLKGLQTDILAGCSAAVFHNVRGPGWLEPFEMAREPILFLAVLCDELQRWHRPPVGSKLLDPDIYEKRRVRPKELTLRSTMDISNLREFKRGRDSAVFAIAKPDEEGRLLADEIGRVLDGKLKDWRRILRIEA